MEGGAPRISFKFKILNTPLIYIALKMKSFFFALPRQSVFLERGFSINVLVLPSLTHRLTH